MNPNFLLAHRNRYSEGMDDGQKTSCEHPKFNSYMKNLCVLVFQTDGQTDRWMDGLTEKLIWCGLPSLCSSRLTPHSHVATVILPCCRCAALVPPPLPLCCRHCHHAATLLPPPCPHRYAVVTYLPPCCHQAATVAKLPLPSPSCQYCHYLHCKISLIMKKKSVG